MAKDIFESRILGTISADSVHIGKGVVVEEGVVIRGPESPAESIYLGDFCHIGHNTEIIVERFKLGDYSKLHPYSLVNGRFVHIGRNCWIGGNTILNGTGGLDIDDGVGIGAHSQIWTHIQFGDIVEGSRFYSRKYMHIKKDVWFVGHCLVSPVKIGERSMAMLGSVVTKEMIANHIYAGSPAKDITEKVGTQFKERTIEEKANILNKLIEKFVDENPEHRNKLKVVLSKGEITENITCFDVSRRVYTKTLSLAEVSFLKSHVPLVKFVPEGEEVFIVPEEESS